MKIKWLAVILVIALYSQCAVVAKEQVKNEIVGWSVSYNNPAPGIQQDTISASTGAPYIPAEIEKDYAITTNNEKYSGEYSLMVAYPNVRQKWTSMNIVAALTNTFSYGTYQFSFYAKGNFIADGIQAGIVNDAAASNGSLVQLSKTSRYSVTDKENGWKYYEFTVSYDDTSTPTPNFHFLFDNQCTQIYLDDISLTKAGETQNYITNPGFETLPQAKPDTYEASCMYVKEMSDLLAVVWKNPSVSDITDVLLYDVTDNKNVLLSDEFTTISGGLCEYKVSNLVAGTQYYFKLVFSYGSHESTAYILSGQPNSNSTVGSFGKWTANYYSASKGFCPVRMSVDKKTKYSGNASLHLENNINGIQDNVYATLTQEVVLEAGKTYQFDLWVKANDGRDIRAYYGDKKFKDDKVWVLTGTKETFDWRKYTFVKECKGDDINSNFKIITDVFCEVWFDDFSVHQVVNNEITGDDLLSNGGFEDSATGATPSEALNVIGSSKENAASISWSNSNGYKKINIYRTEDDILYKRAEVYPPLSSINIDNLTNEKVYDFVVKTENSSGMESEGIKVSVTPMPEDLKISGYQLWKNNILVNSVQAGELTVKTTIKNNNMGDSFGAELAVGVFCGKKMVSLNAQKVFVPMTHYTSSATPVQVTVTVPEGENYHIEVYLWNSLDGMAVLKSYQLFN